ncbi:hypothetical protein C0J52_19107 [Blattella germanica]|nr:hypothetical protein C0J52_19107 [Blattella germanica]
MDIMYVAVCDMRECEGDDADLPLWTSSSVQEVLRQDDPDGRVSETAATTLCHLPCQNPSAQAEWAKLWRCHPTNVSLALLGGRQVLGRPQLRFHLLHGHEQMGGSWLSLYVFHGEDVGRA